MSLVIIIISAKLKLSGVNMVSPCFSLLALYSRNEHFQKTFGVDIGTNLCIRRDLVSTLNDISIAMQDVALDVSTSIRNRLSSRELAPCLNIHVHFGSFHERGIDCNAHCQRIVHRSAGLTEFRRKTHKVLSHGMNEVVHRSVSLAQLIKIFWAKQGLVADI